MMMMMMMIYGRCRRKDGADRTIRSNTVRRRHCPRRPRDRADGRDRCPSPSPVTACLSARPNRPPAAGRWTQSVRQVAAGGDSGKLQAKMAMQAVTPWRQQSENDPLPWSLTDVHPRAVTRSDHDTPKDAYTNSFTSIKVTEGIAYNLCRPGVDCWCWWCLWLCSWAVSYRISTVLIDWMCWMLC